MSSNLKRRNFLRLGASLASFFGLQQLTKANNAFHQPDLLRPATGKSVIGLRVAPIPQVKVAVIGLGNRGEDHVRLVNAIGSAKAVITAICDIRKEAVDKMADFLKKNGAQQPATYSGKPDAWKDMLRRDDIDLVLIATLGKTMCRCQFSPWNRASTSAWKSPRPTR